MRHTAIAIFQALILLAVIAPPALAQDPGDIREGQAIAQRDCAGCHSLSGANRAGTDAPTFAAIAGMPSTTALSIRVYLRTSHINKTMPNLILSEEEIDSLAAFILSLRTR
ncbi:MAG: cytochrome c [Beijerinckiaceae bacterium]